MLSAQSVYGSHDVRIAPAGDVALGRGLYRTVPEDVFDSQPLTGGGGRYLLVADIRLDNRDELLKRLGTGERGGSELCDAAILLSAYERWGDRLLDLILGDYAFALWDQGSRRLMLARDPLGQRPLFYTARKSFVAFSTMPAGLYALPGVPRVPDRVRMAEFLGGVPHRGPRSFHEGINRVEPGHVVTIDGSDVSARRYWNPERHELRLGSFDAYRDAFRAELDRAVACRLRRIEGEVATHLSSGWDSGAVTATAARRLGDIRLTAFTAVPRPGNASTAPFQRITDEGPLAAQTASMHTNVDHVRVAGTAASPIADLDKQFDLFDRPQVNLCNEVWLAQIRTAAAARGACVLLGGEVGNWTISAAPPTLLADLVREGRWGSWLHEARAKIRQGDARYRGVLANSFGPWLPQVAWRLLAPMSVIGSPVAFGALLPARRAELGRVTNGLPSRPPRNSFAQALQGLADYDFGQFRKGALAGWGIDERDPTGDRRLIEFCLSLPVDMLLKNGVRRPLARAALSDRLPPVVLAERNKGYQAADWHEGLTRDLPAISALIEQIADDSEAASMIDVDALRAWVADWPDGGWDRLPVMARYRGALLPALSVGRFMGTMRSRSGIGSR